MSRMHGPSIFLGIGLGIILTALLGGLFFLDYSPLPDEAEIIRRANALGMVKAEAVQVEGVVRKADGTWSVTVSGKDSINGLAEKLVDAGLLSGELEFEIAAKQLGLSDPPAPGKYVVMAGAGAREVAEALGKEPAAE